MTGKGSAPRPFSVDIDTFNKNFDKIFGRQDDERKQREDATRVSDRGDDKRPASEGGDVQPTGNPGT